MSVSLVLYKRLCSMANEIEREREALPPGSDAWTLQTELLAALDTMIDALVRNPAVEAPDDLL